MTETERKLNEKKIFYLNGMLRKVSSIKDLPYVRTYHPYVHKYKLSETFRRE